MSGLGEKCVVGGNLFNVEGDGTHFCLRPDSKAVAEGLGRHI
jgi:hypothetical protein